MTPSLPLLLIKIAGCIAAVITLPGSLELLTVSVAALVPRGPRALPPGPPTWRAAAAALIPRTPRATPAGPTTWRTAVVVPAHNEQVTITSCVESLLQADRPAPGASVDVFVVADNCTDDTARLAALAGAHVLERTNPVEQGKGYALQHAFDHLLPLGYDCVIVVDADSLVAANFHAAMTKAMRGGEQAVQGRYLVRSATETMRSRLMRVALLGFNLVRPLGRDHLGLSCGIFGNGFGLRRETLLAVPYSATSLVEDLEYHLSLVRSGRRVAFLNNTAVYAEIPVKPKDIKTQRARWEGGRLRMFVTAAPSLCRDVLTGQMRCLEPLIDLLLLPLAFHVALLALAIATPLPLARDFGIAGALIVFLHLVAAIVTGGGGWGDFAVLAMAPFYVLWKVMLIPTLLRSARPGEHWIRTGRNAEQDSPKPPVLP